MRRQHSSYISKEEKGIIREALERADLRRKELVDLLVLLIRMSEAMSPEYSFTADQIAYFISSEPSKRLKDWRTYEEETEEALKRYYDAESDDIPF